MLVVEAVMDEGPLQEICLMQERRWVVAESAIGLKGVDAGDMDRGEGCSYARK